MEQSQLVFGVVLIIVLLGMSAVFIWRQWRVLRALQRAENLSAEDRHYSQQQAVRRLVCSALMVILAGLLAVGIFKLEEPAQRLVEQGQAARAQGQEAVMDAQERGFFDLYWNFWIVVLLVLLAIIGLAAVDFLAIRRYARRHYTQIQADRRAMIEGELARLRSQRNGHNS